jgi:hypothetical protein
MSLYKVTGGRYWHFGFKYDGHRFYGSTKTADRQQAELIVRTVRERAKQLGAAAAAASPWRAPSKRYRGLCHCGAHAWSVLTQGYVAFVSPEDSHLLEACSSTSATSKGTSLFECLVKSAMCLRGSEICDGHIRKI